MKTDLNITSHISKRYNQELEQIRSMLTEMGELVFKQVEDGLECLLNLNAELAEQVIANDKKVNQLEIKIDVACTHILATRQPTASDLRLILCVIKTITDIERIGDEAIKLGKNALKIINSDKNIRQFNELKHLGEHVITNLRLSLLAYATLNVDAALRALEQDKNIDEEFDNISRLLITKMMEDPREVKNSLRITWCARALERIGDHSKNVSEHVIFLVKGKDIRHASTDQIKQTLSEL
ncbi:phosphate signaling complex protein PhoU [Psychromonas sp. MME2]|uniref:phosphate signaling complex protein PhoU n=1 Tax=unclassified Psychromonas TaxID=2614957 RepID=UPI00339C46F2